MQLVLVSALLAFNAALLAKCNAIPPQAAASQADDTKEKRQGLDELLNFGPGLETGVTVTQSYNWHDPSTNSTTTHFCAKVTFGNDDWDSDGTHLDQNQMGKAFSWLIQMDNHGYYNKFDHDLPTKIAEEHGIPTSAFSCPSTFQAECMVAEQCFDGKGQADEIQAAWTFLVTVASFRKAMKVILGAQFIAGPAMIQDVVGMLNDFYNGVYGDGPIPAENLLTVQMNLLYWLPYGISRFQYFQDFSKKAFDNAKANAWGVNFNAARQGTNFAGGAAALFSEMNSLFSQLNNGSWSMYGNGWEDIGQINWEFIQPLPLSDRTMQADVSAAVQKWQSYERSVFFMSIMKQQQVFIHRQPIWDSDDISCEDVEADYTAVWCDANPPFEFDGQKNVSYYVTQIYTEMNNGQNELVVNFPPWQHIDNWGLDTTTMIKNARDCATSSGQTYDLNGAWPAMGDVTESKMEFDNQTAIPVGKDPGDISCMYNFPVVSFSEGPEGTSNWKWLATAENAIPNLFGHDITARGKWKDSNLHDAETWNDVESIHYCATSNSLFGIGTVVRDEALLSDMWGISKLVPQGTMTGDALWEVNRRICDKDKSDSWDTAIKEGVDFAIGSLAFVAGYPACGIICGAVAAQLADQVLDDVAADRVLKWYIDNNDWRTLSPEQSAYVNTTLNPFFDTKRLGEGD